MELYVFIVISMVVGYLFGSIPFALIIGKIFYKTDVREYGSGNLGSTNVARTLGIGAGLITLILDALKGGLVPFIMYTISKNAIDTSYNDYLPSIYYITGIFVCIGHCFPIFTKFKGGKAVASIFGFLIFMNYRLALLALGTFIIVFLISRIVSLSSISAAIIVMILHFIPFLRNSYLFNNLNFDPNNKIPEIIFSITIFILGTLLICRHIPNIKRLFKHEEKQFKFSKKKNLENKKSQE